MSPFLMTLAGTFQGYSRLYGDDDMYDVLYVTMLTAFGITWPCDYGPGFRTMTQYCSYYNFSYTLDQYIIAGDYWTVVDDIDSGWPTALCIYIPDRHWRAIRGYYYNTDIGDYQVICTDSAARSDWYVVDWTSWGINAALVCIKD